jgi:ArsR family transcriptional regulator, arsenate/arsenite/antimonite-responsive transcriptional repressor
MDTISIYKCLCDEVRLRILNLVQAGPLCVCHIQEILGEPQAKVSKQLSFMKRYGLLESSRCCNWTIYRLSDSRSPVFETNLKCLQDCQGEFPVFKADLVARRKLIKRLKAEGSDCPIPEVARQALDRCEGTGCCE